MSAVFTLTKDSAKDDVAEALQHVAIYAGVPKANHALKLAKQTFVEMEENNDA